MIDLRTLRTDPDRLRISQRTRGEDDSVVDRLLDLDERRRSALSSFESLRAEQKSFGRSVSKAQGEERQRLLERAKELAQQVKDADAESQRLDQELTELLWTVPNIVEEGAPVHGGTLTGVGAVGSWLFRNGWADADISALDVGTRAARRCREWLDYLRRRDP